jgi:spore maturation protein SpmB
LLRYPATPLALLACLSAGAATPVLAQTATQSGVAPRTYEVAAAFKW